MAQEIERARALGVQRMQVFLEEEPRDETLRLLDEVVAAIPS
jgi:hypothetical protein